MTDTEKLQAIATKLAADSDLASLPDEQIAASLLAIDPALATTRRVPVQSTAARAILLAAGHWAKIGMVARGRTASHPELEALCFTVYDALTLQVSMATDLPEFYSAIQAALGGLVSVGVLSAEVMARLLSLADEPVERSWADAHVEGRYISAEDIAAARGK